MLFLKKRLGEKNKNSTLLGKRESPKKGEPKVRNASGYLHKRRGKIESDATYEQDVKKNWRSAENAWGWLAKT